jgi:hypothetical protein
MGQYRGSGTMRNGLLFSARDHKFKEARVMKLKTLATMAAAAGLLTMVTGLPAAHAQEQVITNGPQSHNLNGNSWVHRNGEWVWSPQLNVRQSERYSHLVANNPRFREMRMSKECGPITDPTLHQRCLDSFQHELDAWNNIGQTQPNYGSSMPPANNSTGAGR